MSEVSFISLRGEPRVSLSSNIDRMLATGGLIIKVRAHGKEIPCPKLVMLARCVNIRDKVWPIQTALEVLDLTEEFENEIVFTSVMSILLGQELEVEDVNAIKVIRVLNSWLGDNSHTCLRFKQLVSKTRIGLETEGELLVRYLDNLKDGSDRTICISAHGTRISCSKFVLSQRCPALTERLIPVAVPGGSLDVSGELIDGTALEYIMKIIEGGEVEVEPPYDTHIPSVLKSWVDKAENIIVKKVKRPAF